MVDVTSSRKQPHTDSLQTVSREEKQLQTKVKVALGGNSDFHGMIKLLS